MLELKAKLMSSEQRVSFLNPYVNPGGFSGEQMGIVGEGSLVYPINDLLPLQTQTTNSADSYFFITDSPQDGKRHLYFTHMGQVFEDPIQRVDVSHISKHIPDPRIIKALPDFERFYWAGVEGNFACNAFSNMLSPQRVLGVYFIINHVIQQRLEEPLWKTLPATREVFVDQFLLNPNLYGNLVGIFGLPDNVALNSVRTEQLQTRQGRDLVALLIKQFGFVYRNAFGISDFIKMMVDVSPETVGTLQKQFYSDPRFMLYMGSFLFSLLKSNLTDSLFTDDELIHAVVGLANSEGRPRKLTEGYGTLKSEFSSYLNLDLDLTLRKIAPLTFALGNRALLEELNMVSDQYLTRMRASRMSVSPLGLNLKTIDELLPQFLGTENEFKERAQGINAATYTATSKSIFSAVNESLNEPTNHQIFYTLLERFGIQHPKKEQLYLISNFRQLQAFEQLIKIWLEGNNDLELTTFISNTYESIKKTPDLIRASLFPKKQYLNAIVDEAIQREDLDVLLCVNYHDDTSHFKRINLKSPEELAQFASELGIDPPNLQEVITAWYEQKKDYVPYAAIHIYGSLQYRTGLYDEHNNLAHHRGELRVAPAENELDFSRARQKFKVLEDAADDQTPGKN